ncbi:hypothetical protein ACPUYX_19650 [Desulfosporosinus sp. SYSU MS00001]|uniref:hypothetical protein n=1 Tax=Desulfosporosinus sp. SYSU MS00001 TaxID=3416284 RepID=UPI003CEC4534
MYVQLKVITSETLLFCTRHLTFFFNRYRVTKKGYEEGDVHMPITVYKSDIAAAKIQYNEYLAGKAGGFTAGLFDLMPHADIGQRRKLALAFPAHVYVYMQYFEELHRIDFVVKEA